MKNVLVAITNLIRGRTGYVVLVLLFVACSANLGTHNSDVVSLRHSDSLILEVWTESKYTVYPPGKILNLRFDGTDVAEFDYYPNQDTKSTFFTERRRFQLETGERERIVKAVEPDSVRGWKDVYEPTVRILDAAIETRIIIKRNAEEKTILLQENHSNLILEKKAGIYPEQLLDLLRFIQEVNFQLLSGQRPSDAVN